MKNEPQLLPIRLKGPRPIPLPQKATNFTPQNDATTSPPSNLQPHPLRIEATNKKVIDRLLLGATKIRIEGEEKGKKAMNLLQLLLIEIPPKSQIPAATQDEVVESKVQKPGDRDRIGRPKIDQTRRSRPRLGARLRQGWLDRPIIQGGWPIMPYDAWIGNLFT
ncbi:hypothetical protein Taro_050018 [Colocasia esculenta]|uniref:Uncharacterized protein n=1 Tax=Colocasia esculenta TaxID=4460 RepID=A0A843XCR2_COLES|nr:hypothetical protein [Colocasia esculenta]